MSAFVVSKATMDRVVSDWCSNQWLPGNRFDGKQLDKVGRDLFKMNCDAVNQRYRGERDIDPLCEDYKFTAYHCPWSAVQRLKAIQCLKYQCTEGNVPDVNPLYKELEQRCESLSHEIIAELPAYRAADWDASDATDAVNELVRLV